MALYQSNAKVTNTGCLRTATQLSHFLLTFVGSGKNPGMHHTNLIVDSTGKVNSSRLRLLNSVLDQTSRKWVDDSEVFLVISNCIFYETLYTASCSFDKAGNVIYLRKRWKMRTPNGGHTSSLHACHTVFYVLNAWCQMRRNIIYFLRQIHVFFF